MKTGGLRSGWFKSSRSGDNNNCVETKFDGAAVHVRDSKYQGDLAAQPIITVTPREWTRFLAGLSEGRNTLAAQPSTSSLGAVLRTATDAAGNVTLSGKTTTLTFTPAEWKAFTEGVALGEFAIAA